MKTKTLSLILFSVLNFKSMAEEITLPTITKPQVLQEGTQTTLNPAEIAELLPWAKDSKVFLIDLVDSIQGLSIEDKIFRLELGIKQVVNESAPKHTELLMRYVLNRGLVIKDILVQEMDSSAVGSADVKLRVLLKSINKAIAYYDHDMDMLTKKTVVNFQVFAYEYFEFLTDVNQSIFDASAQYLIQRTSFEWLQWDLYRDLNNAQYAPKIIKINNALKLAPTEKMSDALYIKQIQQLKKVAAQLQILQKNKNGLTTQKSDAVKDSTTKENPNKSKYYYSTYYKSCYKISSAGDVMYSDPVNSSYCTADGEYSYSSYYQNCYKKSLWGDVMYSDSVKNSYCADNGKYYYSSYYQKCYKQSLWGDVMYSDSVKNSYCSN